MGMLGSSCRGMSTNSQRESWQRVNISTFPRRTSSPHGHTHHITGTPYPVTFKCVSHGLDSMGVAHAADATPVRGDNLASVPTKTEICVFPSTVLHVVEVVPTNCTLV